MDVLERAALRHPGDAKIRYRLGVLYAAQGQPREAAESFARAVERDTLFAAAYERLGIAAEEIGDTRTAEYALERAVVLSSSPVPCIVLGAHYERQGQWQKAIDALELAVERDPDGKEPYRSLATLYELVGRIEPAIEALERVVEMDEGDTSARAELERLRRAE